MLYIKFGTIDMSTAPRQYIRDIDGFFDGYFENYWVDDWAKKVVLEIDKSTFLSPKTIQSPVLDVVPYFWISGGSKQLIMMNIEQSTVYDGDNFGDNCFRLLLELGQMKDIQMTLSYFPRFNWLDGAKATIIGTGEVVDSFDSFSDSFGHGSTYERFDFNKIDWPIKINPDAFKEDEIDF